MSSTDLQQSVAAFMTANDLNPSLSARLHDLVSEVGELSKELLKSTDYGQLEHRVSTQWIAELGDVFYSLITIANSTDVNLGEALAQSMAKYRKRIEAKGEPGSNEPE